MKVSDYIVQYLTDIGIKNVYYLSGGAIMYIVESLRKSNLNLIPVLNEEDASIMSEADNIYANRLNSVVITTAGPGILNAVNAIASAYIDGNPLLILGGQCKTADSKYETGLRQRGVQEVDAVEILKPITKYSTSVIRKGRIKYELEKSIYKATHERQGSVFLEIPLDIQGMDIEDSCISSYYQANSNIQYELETNKINFKIDKLIELVNNSKKPVILAGNGIRQSGTLEQFKELIEKLRIPVLLSWKSKDFITEDNSLNFGMSGSIASKYANNILQECDLLISIGARVDLPTCAYDYKNFAKNAKKVIVDIDRAEIDKLEFKKELVFNCDAKIFVEKLYNEIERRVYSSDYKKIYNNIIHLEWWEQCNTLKIDNPILTHNSKLIDPYTFVEQLSELTDKDDIIVASSSGSASEIMAQAYKIKGNQRYISSNGLGSMGYAVSAAVGACISSGKKRVICIEGDGSFAMNFKSLHLIKKYNLPIKIFIFNNNGYQSIKNTHNKFFNNSDVVNELTFPEIKRIANAYKISWTYYESNEEVKDMLSWELADSYPTIIECMVDETIQTQPRVQSYVDENGKMQSGTLEKMWPFEEDTNK